MGKLSKTMKRIIYFFIFGILCLMFFGAILVFAEEPDPDALNYLDISHGWSGPYQF